MDEKVQKNYFEQVHHCTLIARSPRLVFLINTGIDVRPKMSEFHSTKLLL